MDCPTQEHPVKTELNVEAIPLDIKILEQWVAWRYVKDDKGDLDKPPLQIDGSDAKSNDPTTWTSFDNAFEAYANSDFSGVGFVFSETDEFCGIDLDGCRNPDTGTIDPWGQFWITRFDSYTEISPSKSGVKIWTRGQNPRPTGGNIKVDQNGPLPKGAVAPAPYGKKTGVEIYEKGRYFTVTGWHLPTTPATIEPRQEAIDEFVKHYWPPQKKTTASEHRPTNSDRQQILKRARAYIAKMPSAISGQGGHNTAFNVACELFRFGLTDDEAEALFHEYNQRCEPPWNEREVAHKLASGRNTVTAAGEFELRLRDDESKREDGIDLSHIMAMGGSAQETKAESPVEIPTQKPLALTVRKLCEIYPRLRKPVIHGLLREGETLNVIAPPKTGKSWLVNALALSTATGANWLGIYPCEPGEVLILDNELHCETSAHRIPIVANALGIDLAECADRIHVANLRGCPLSVPMFGQVLDQFQPGKLKIVIVDAWYRALPPDVDENSNGDIASLYGWIDRFALRMGCAFVLIHHSTKGSQNGKSITDIGAGAGSQARATDTHLVLRPHEEANCVVLDAAVRSWAPVEPRVLRWSFPIWTPAGELDPADLKPDRPVKAKKDKAAETPKEPDWTRERFVSEFIGSTPKTKAAITAAAVDEGLTEHRVNQFMTQGEAVGIIHRWRFGGCDPHQFATVPQPKLIDNNDSPDKGGGKT